MIDCTLDDIAAALRYLDCSDTDVWLRAGMAIKREFGDSGFDVWDSWSQGDSRYKAKECRARWKGWKGSNARGSVTIATILHWAFEKGFTIERPDMTPEQKAAFAKEKEEHRKKMAEQWAKEEADTKRGYEVVAQACQNLLPVLRTVGNSPYLGQKKIQSCGALFLPCDVVMEFKPDMSIDTHIGQNTDAFWERKQANDAQGIETVFLRFNRGSILIPMYNAAKELRSFQIIFNDGKSKRFITKGQKSGLWMVIGNLNATAPAVLFCEGFATGASLWEATKCPVVVCFDAGNLVTVAAAWKNYGNNIRPLIVCGDNDWEKALEPNKINTGLVKAELAARALGGSFCVPRFSDDLCKGLSDFNDLHVNYGLSEVEKQIGWAIQNHQDHFRDATEMLYSSPDSPPVIDVPLSVYQGLDSANDSLDEFQDAAKSSVDVRTQTKGEKTVFSMELLLERFCFVVQDGSVWDLQTNSQIKKSAFNDFVGKSLADEWRGHDQRKDMHQAEINKQKSESARQLREAVFAGSDKWKLNFTRNDRGEIKADIGNAKLVLENDPRWRGVVAYCCFSYRVLKKKAPPFSQGEEGEWTDVDTDRFRIWLSENYAFTPRTADALGAIVVAAEANGFHPVQDYLQSLVWDKKLRLDRWLSSYMGAEFSKYSLLVGRMFLIGAVARVMRPPVKMDNVIIFEGLQGLGKSTALGILADPWFTDTPFALGDKDGFQQIQGVWIVELAELDSLNKAESTRAKQFFASQTDRYRPSYGRMTVTFPRQCVFAGSTNQDNYLKDSTGNRRYWPVKCTGVDAAALKRDRDQLWAEAFYAYQFGGSDGKGEKWWPSNEDKHLFEEEQEKRFDRDVWEDLIEPWLLSITKHRVLMSEIMEEALGLEPSQMKPPEQKRVGQIMAHLGWVKVRARVGNGRETGYERPVAIKAAA